LTVADKTSLSFMMEKLRQLEGSFSKP